MIERSQRQSWSLVLRMSKMGKPIKFSQHALDNMTDRGASREEVETAIRRENAYLQKKGGYHFVKILAIMCGKESFTISNRLFQSL